MRDLRSIRKPHLLLVEGEEERVFWDTFFAARDRPDVQVESIGGKYQLRRTLPAVVRAPAFHQVRWLGIAQDADDDPRAAFDRIRGALRQVSLPVPRRSWELTGAAPVVVALVLPDGQSPGDLETLVWEGVKDHPSAGCVDAYLRCLEEGGIAPRQASKARVHAFLASLDRPDRRLGEAMRAGLEVKSPGLERLLRLFPPDAGIADG